MLVRPSRLPLAPHFVRRPDSLLAFFTSFLLLSIYYYLPTHVSFLRRRAAYYITGDESFVLLGEDGLRAALEWFRGSRTTAKEIAVRSAGDMGTAKVDL